MLIVVTLLKFVEGLANPEESTDLPGWLWALNQVALTYVLTTTLMSVVPVLL